MENIIEKKYYESVKDLDELKLINIDKWYEHVLNLPEDLQVVYTVVLFDTQIENGGFHQYFFNSYGQFSFLTLKNLRKIKSIQISELLEKAIKIVNYEKLSESDFRNKVFNREITHVINFEENLMNSLDLLDNEYYDTKSEDIYALLTLFLKEYP